MDAGQRPAGAGKASFEYPHIDIPEGVKQAAAAGLEQVKESYEKLKINAEAMGHAVEDSCTTAVKGTVDLQTKMLESFSANIAASLEFVNALAAAKTLPEAIEISTRFLHRQFEALTAQSKDFWSFGQKVMADAAKPVASGFARGVDRAASS